MKARILYILLCGAFYFCSTPFGMAQEAVREDVRADFFAAEEAGSEEDRQVKAVFNDAGLVEFADCECEGESGVDGEEDSKRENKRTLSYKIFTTKCRVLCRLSKKSLSKGAAKHPESQDAGQERTAAVRFLLICALA